MTLFHVYRSVYIIQKTLNFVEIFTDNLQIKSTNEHKIINIKIIGRTISVDPQGTLR